MWFRNPPSRAAQRTRRARYEALEPRLAMSLPAGAVAVPRILNGHSTSGFPAVGIVGDAEGGFCTGTLISPQHVLTAAHCAVEMDGPTDGRFVVGGAIYRTSAVLVHPGWNEDDLGTDAADDLALLQLASAVTGVAPAPLFRGTPRVGQTLTLVGYGAAGNARDGADDSFGVKRVGQTRLDGLTAKLLTWNFDSNRESNTGPGDSGGPAFLRVGGTYYLAGVTSGGTEEDSGLGDFSYDTRVDAYADWIDSLMPAAAAASTAVGVLASDATASERSSGSNPGVFLFNRVGNLAEPLTVHYTLSGTAAAEEDYRALPGTVEFPAGKASVAVKVRTINDRVAETTETLELTIAADPAYSRDTERTSATITIVDNDPFPKPANDRFANRTPLSGTDVSVTGTNRGATRESHEPKPVEDAGKPSVWWSWTATASGEVTVSTAESDFDTTLAVYTGSALRRLELVAANDDANLEAGILTSALRFDALAGGTYQIVVNGYRTDVGQIRLTLSQDVEAGSGLAALAEWPLDSSRDAAKERARRAYFARLAG